MKIQKNKKRGISLTHHLIIQQKPSQNKDQNINKKIPFQHSILPKPKIQRQNFTFSKPKQQSFTLLMQQNQHKHSFTLQNPQREFKHIRFFSGLQRKNHHFSNLTQKIQQIHQKRQNKLLQPHEANINPQKQCLNKPSQYAQIHFTKAQYNKLLQKRQQKQNFSTKSSQKDTQSQRKKSPNSKNQVTLRSKSKKKSQQNLFALNHMQNRFGTIINACTRRFK